MVSERMNNIAPNATPVFVLRVVEPANVRRWWSIVRHGLEKVVDRTDPDWIPEDVYVALRSGEASLLLGFEDDLYVGFAVVLKRVHPFDGTPVLFIWALYIRTIGKLDALMDLVLANAKQDGFKSLVFQSPRKAWQRRLWARGFKLREHIFECKLGEKNG